MPLNLGLDFGSTTSILSLYEENNGGLQTIILDHGVPYIPSKISHSENGGNPNFGVSARSDIGKTKRRVYEAFKTLLNNAPDSNIVIQRGYDSKNTPEFIAREFLDLLFRKVMNDRNVDKIDNLVVGVPENWGRSVQALKRSNNNSICRSMGTKRLTDILESLSYIKNFKIVFEPEAASAFFVYNYNRINAEKNKTLNGNVLIIDYGGGSLDITLSEVRTNGDGKMEIKLIDSDGLGENQDEENGMVGSAGILYIESLIKCALHEANIDFDLTNPENKRQFDKLRAEIELKLRDNKDDIEDTFESINIDNEMLEELNNTPLIEEICIKTRNNELKSFDISYGQLYRVYNNVIKPELEKIINNVLKRNPNIAVDKKNFKIGLVGGFSNFYFVRRQIWDIFRISNANDPLVDGLLTNPEEQEKAISLGAALISNDIINLCVTSEFAIGVFTRETINGKTIAVPHFAIKYRQELEYEHFYYSYVYSGKGKSESGNSEKRPKQLITSPIGTINELIIHRDKDIRHIMNLIPCLDNQTASELKGIIKFQANIAFAISKDGTILIKVDEVEDIGRGNFKIVSSKIVSLAKFDEMFTNYTSNNQERYTFEEWVKLVENGEYILED